MYRLLRWWVARRERAQEHALLAGASIMDQRVGIDQRLVRVRTKCSHCGGRGYTLEAGDQWPDSENCSKCGGTGLVGWNAVDGSHTEKCPECDGKGRKLPDRAFLPGHAT